MWEEVQGEDPSQARSYIPHTICRHRVYSNQARSELPTGFGTGIKNDFFWHKNKILKKIYVMN
jgi:hypothetical protein